VIVISNARETGGSRDPTYNRGLEIMGGQGQSPYQGVHIEDLDESRTDVETIDLNEKDYLHMHQPRRDGWLTTLKSHRWLLDTVLLLVVIALLLEKGWSTHGKSHYFEGAGDITGFAPECKHGQLRSYLWWFSWPSPFYPVSQKITTFSPDPAFVPDDPEEFLANHTRRKWLEIIPSTW
jgi:hypothetical protein